MKERGSSSGFTLIELVAVILIIGVLMALILGASRGIREGNRRRMAESQIMALSSAMESYKADHGTYPRGSSGETDSDPRTLVDPSPAGSLFLYKELSGDSDASFSRAQPADETANRVYLEFEAMKSFINKNAGGTPGQAGYVDGLADPWGNFYGYSTLRAKLIEQGNPSPSAGYNPDFDLWSTANAPTEPQKWVDNW